MQHSSAVGIAASMPAEAVLQLCMQVLNIWVASRGVSLGPLPGLHAGQAYCLCIATVRIYRQPSNHTLGCLTRIMVQP